MAAPSDSQMEVIKRAKVMKVGPGGIGCKLFKTLALSGFQDIHIGPLKLRADLSWSADDNTSLREDGYKSGLLSATGIREEMIVGSMKKCEEKTVALTLNPEKVLALRNKLKAVQIICPLFDNTIEGILQDVEFIISTR